MLNSVYPLLHHHILHLSPRSGPKFAVQIEADQFSLVHWLQLVQIHPHQHIPPRLLHLTFPQNHRHRQLNLVSEELQITLQRLLT
jgi:hypothetical protein